MNQENNPYAAPASLVQEAGAAPAATAPAMWNPNAAALWSLLFSPVFGGYLQMRNWQALGDNEKASMSWYWCIGSLVMILAVVGISMFLPETHWFSKLSNRFGFILLIAWYASHGKLQVAYVKEKFGKDYPRKSWTLPLLTGFGAVIGFFVAIFLLYMVLAMTGMVQVPA